MKGIFVSLMMLSLIMVWMTTNLMMIFVLIQMRLMMRLLKMLVANTRQTLVVFSLQLMVKILDLNLVSCSRMYMNPKRLQRFMQ